MTERDIKEIQAGNTFRDTLVPRADSMSGHAPLWHGWVIMDAFLAGIDYAREDADHVCDSYAAENQRFHDEIDRLTRELADARAALVAMTSFRDGLLVIEKQKDAEIERLQEAWHGRCVIIDECDIEIERLKIILWHSREDMMGVAQEIDKVLGTFNPTRPDEQKAPYRSANIGPQEGEPKVDEDDGDHRFSKDSYF